MKNKIPVFVLFIIMALSFINWKPIFYESHSDYESFTVPDTVLNSESQYIAVFGDIQNCFISNVNMNYYRESLEWIADHKDNIRFMLHTGDITNFNTVSEYTKFDSITAPFTEIMPFYTCIGNHDYRCNAPNPWIYRDSTRFNDYVGYNSTLSHIVAYYDTTKYENILVEEELFEGEPVYLLILELEPRRDVVHWADSLIRLYPDNNVILITHRYISASGKRYLNKNYMTDPESTAPQFVWDSLIYHNDNIRFVLCGHVASLSRVLYSTNITGRIVPQLEFNIQKLPHGGDGVIALWEFDRLGNVFVRTYNTHSKQYVNDSITEFQFKF